MQFSRTFSYFLCPTPKWSTQYPIPKQSQSFFFAWKERHNYFVYSGVCRCNCKRQMNADYCTAHTKGYVLNKVIFQL